MKNYIKFFIFFEKKFFLKTKFINYYQPKLISISCNVIILFNAFDN